MKDNELALLWLDYFEFASYKKKEKLLERVAAPSELLNKEILLRVKSKAEELFSNDEWSILLKNSNREFAEKILLDCQSLGVSVIARTSETFPQRLRDIDSPPFVLYFKGDATLLKRDCFGIVGTRKISSYGKAVTEKFTRSLVESDFVIVSGLASGVDTVAHSTTLACKGRTIAVLAGGLDEIYPAMNTRLSQQIVASGGLLVSEVRPRRRADSFMFPIRNRIIAALSRGVLITEASEKSGAIHTKNYALEYGKDVFAVPGSIFNLTSAGANRMISNGQAKAAVDVESILCEYNLTKKRVQTVNYSMEESVIIELLRGGEMPFQTLVERTNMEVKKLNTLLTMLSIRGIIKKLAGNIYFLIS